MQLCLLFNQGCAEILVVLCPLNSSYKTAIFRFIKVA
jgi:hypothetical protein